MPTPEAIDAAQPTAYDAAYAILTHAIGEAESRYTGPARSRHDADSDTLRIVVASYIHIPFHDTRAIGRMIAGTRDRDLLVLAGDIMDTYSLSRFVRYRQVPIDTEIAAVKVFLETVSAHYPRVLIVEGNHDRPRLEKQLRTRCNDDNLMAALEVLTGGNFSLVRACARHLPNIEFAVNEVNGYRVRWFTQVGDCLISHAEKFSKVPGSALRQVDDWFTDQHDMLDLAPWRVLIQAHTHQLSRLPWRANKLMMESGCLAQTQGYHLDPRISGRPQRLGYITLTQHHGKTDINSAREWWIDAADDWERHAESETADTD